MQKCLAVIREEWAQQQTVIGIILMDEESPLNWNEVQRYVQVIADSEAVGVQGTHRIGKGAGGSWVFPANGAAFLLVNEYLSYKFTGPFTPLIAAPAEGATA